MSKVLVALEKAIKAIEHPWNVSTAIMPNSLIEAINLCKSALSDIEKCEPVLKVYQGEICYKSQADDQSYGMWCPVNFDTEHFIKEGTEFYTSPISKEWVGIDVETIDDIGNTLSDEQGFIPVETWTEFARAIEAKLKQLNVPEKG